MKISSFIAILLSWALLAALGCATAALADHPAAAFGLESSGPINTISAQPLNQGDWSIGLRLELIDFDAFSDAQLEAFAREGVEDVHSVDRLASTSLALAYGISNDLMLSLRLPHISRTNIREGEIEDGEAEAHEHGNASGVGDLVILGHYRFWKNRDFSAALQAGIKTPTGETDVEDDGQVLEIEFQPGSGSWDFLFGGAVSFSPGRVGYHANLLYNLTTEGDQDTELGDAFFYNAAVTYRLSGGARNDHGHHHTAARAHPHFMVDAMLELNGETRAKNQIDGEDQDNSGGTLLYLSPGIRLSHTRGLSAFVSYAVPIVSDPNGEQADPDYRLVGGISLNF